MSSTGAAADAAHAARAAAAATEAEVLDWVPPSSVGAQSGDEDDEVIAGFASPILGAPPATGGVAVGTQTEAHVFIATFVAGATNGELTAAVNALSVDDLARLMAACSAAQPAAGPPTPPISSPPSSSGTTPPASTALPVPSAVSGAPPGAMPAKAWLAPSGASSSVVPGPSAEEARKYWLDQEAAIHHDDAPPGIGHIDDDDEGLEGDTGLDAYLADFDGAVPKAPPDTTFPMPFGAYCPAGATVRWPKQQGMAPPPPPPSTPAPATSSSSGGHAGQAQGRQAADEVATAGAGGSRGGSQGQGLRQSPATSAGVGAGRGGGRPGDAQAPTLWDVRLGPALSGRDGRQECARQRRAIDQENALRALAGMGPMGFDVTYDEMLQLRIQRELREMSLQPPPPKPAGQQPPEVVVPQRGADPERDHPPRSRAAAATGVDIATTAPHLGQGEADAEALERRVADGSYHLPPNSTVVGIFLRGLPPGVQGGKLPRDTARATSAGASPSAPAPGTDRIDRATAIAEGILVGPFGRGFIDLALFYILAVAGSARAGQTEHLPAIRAAGVKCIPDLFSLLDALAEAGIAPTAIEALLAAPPPPAVVTEMAVIQAAHSPGRPDVPRRRAHVRASLHALRPENRKRSVEELRDGYLAETSKGPYASRLKTWMALSYQGKVDPWPVSAETMEALGAAFKKGGYRSANKYFLAAFRHQEHDLGQEVSPVLRRLANRAVKSIVRGLLGCQLEGPGQSGTARLWWPCLPRGGGARGVPLAVIQLLGCWSSRAIERYTQAAPLTLAPSAPSWALVSQPGGGTGPAPIYLEKTSGSTAPTPRSRTPTGRVGEPEAVAGLMGRQFFRISAAP
ncbi:unnamed protein product [Symbiodinium sp. CCMP2592]|nr:unnamed protein product [Symbiodinium sp. CCMP2592]